ncbi:MAG: hypothetical protein HQ488_03470 [Parcubacteria group bacterium]|nr:hypothetical protein [Parcubacteria group bacterium]
MRYLPILFITLGLSLSFTAYAGIDDIVFPIDALGSCESEDACFTYCEDPDNWDACIAFAEENDLLEESEVEEYHKMEALLAEGGPGGCSSDAECEAFCTDVTNMSECIAFAEIHDMMDDGELHEAKQVLAALDAGYQMPGGCSNEVSCDAYCSDPSHMDECLTFAEAAGFMSSEEIEEMRTMKDVMLSGDTPGGCTDRDSCEEYCEDPVNMDECVDFAIRSGFMTVGEAEMMKEHGMRDRGDYVGPGGCVGDTECKIYCNQQENMEECAEFFGDDFTEHDGGDDDYQSQGYELHGDEDSFVGPGGCVGKDECSVYCFDPVNIEECMLFAGGMMSGDDYGEHGDSVLKIGEDTKDEWHMDVELEIHEGEIMLGDDHEKYYDLSDIDIDLDAAMDQLNDFYDGHSSNDADEYDKYDDYEEDDRGNNDEDTHDDN